MGLATLDVIYEQSRLQAKGVATAALPAAEGAASFRALQDRLRRRIGARTVPDL
jgi:hypothetical protein